MMFMRHLGREAVNQIPTAVVGYSGTIMSVATGEGVRIWIAWALGCLLTITMIASTVIAAWQKTGWVGLDRVKRWFRIG